jgi:hypothetical protein
MKIIVTIPALNEAKNIGKVISIVSLMLEITLPIFFASLRAGIVTIIFIFKIIDKVFK